MRIYQEARTRVERGVLSNSETAYSNDGMVVRKDLASWCIVVIPLSITQSVTAKICNKSCNCNPLTRGVYLKVRWIED